MNRARALSAAASKIPPMPTSDPSIVAWTDHALVKAEMLGFARIDVEQAVLDGHQQRVRNPGAADWLLEHGRLVVAYNHPDQGDHTTALIVTLWRRI